MTETMLKALIEQIKGMGTLVIRSEYPEDNPDKVKDFNVEIFDMVKDLMLPYADRITGAEDFMRILTDIMKFSAQVVQYIEAHDSDLSHPELTE